MTTPTAPRRPPLSDPPNLLAILLMARRGADRLLERAAKRELRDQYGIDISFRRTPAGKGADDA